MSWQSPRARRPETPTEVLAWLRGAAYRHVYWQGHRARVVEKLIADGKAYRAAPHSTRVYAMPAAPLGKAVMVGRELRLEPTDAELRGSKQ